jgi:aminoglycoside phosphotransferase (APT) family kinase protein
VVGALRFEQIAGGHSNLTFKLTDEAGHAWVLRRPPLGHVLATAHDVAREARIITALASTDVPVAPVVGVSADDSVNGAPFYVMEFVDGIVVRHPDDAKRIDAAVRPTVTHNLVDVLARIHAVDVDAVGLGDLARRDGYIERQLKRWQGQLEQSLRPELPEIGDLSTFLAARVPEQQQATIVHGDYRLDNCMVSPSGEVVAVLDWEICTLGDPLADVGLLVVYWGDPDQPSGFLNAPPTLSPGFGTAADAVAAYAQASGRDLSQLDYYVAFGYWKLFCIVAGVYKRYVEGAMGTEGSAEAFKPMLDYLGGLADAARSAAGRLS